MDRVVITAGGLIERVIAGRTPPEVPIAARILCGGEQHPVDVESHAGRVIHVVIDEGTVGAIRRGREARIGGHRADGLIGQAGDGARHVGHLLVGVDREFARRRQFGVARLEGEFVPIRLTQTPTICRCYPNKLRFYGIVELERWIIHK
jgi:hypothetical protein